MYSFWKKLSLYVLFSSFVCSSPAPTNDVLSERDIAVPLPVNVVHQFPDPTWIENLAIRDDSGSGILCTILTTPDLYLVDPSTGSATLLHTFGSVLGLVGIAQVGHDIFYVAGGNFSATTSTVVPGSWTIFEVDIRGYGKYGVTGIKVKELVVIEGAVLLNGLTRLDAASKTLLVADSFVGGVWEVDVETGAYKLGISVSEMKAAPGSNNPAGVNGIKVKGGYLYFTNGSRGSLSRVAIDVMTGSISGMVEVLASGLQPDDFTLGRGGRIWIAQNFVNTISVLLKNGTVVNVAGSPNSLLVPGPSSCQFGTEGKLYCSTTGGLESQVDGKTVGGEIIVIDTKDFDL